MKVLLIARTIAFGGGTETLVFETYHELKKQIGVNNVKLIVFQHTSIFNVNDIDYYEKVLENDPNFHCVDIKMDLKIIKKNNINIQEIQKIVDDFKPSIIHSHLYLSELVSRNINFKKAKWFTHFHDNMEQFENFQLSTLFKKKKLVNFYEKNYLFRKYKNNNFIAISKDTYNYAKKRIRGNKLFLLENGINLNNYFRYQKINKDKIRLINIGSFVEKKNQKFILEIACYLKNQSINFEVLLLGDGPLKEEIKNLVFEKKLQKEIIFLGIVENVNFYLNSSNIYLHTAKYEPFGLVLLEAMAVELPVISLDGLGNRDIVKNNYNGFLIQEEDPKKFSELIIKTFQNKEIYEMFSKNSKEFSKKFDIKTYVKNLIKIYNY
jgi:glycosyltransferase involved in cell wall biosynthesis